MAIAAPVVSLLLSRVPLAMKVPVTDPSRLQAAYTSQFFITMSLTEAPGLLLVALAFIKRLTSVQVTVGLVLTAMVVWMSLRPTRQKAEGFVQRTIGPDAYGEQVDRFMAQF